MIVAGDKSKRLRVTRKRVTALAAILPIALVISFAVATTVGASPCLQQDQCALSLVSGSSRASDSDLIAQADAMDAALPPPLRNQGGVPGQPIFVPQPTNSNPLQQGNIRSGMSMPVEQWSGKQFKGNNGPNFGGGTVNGARGYNGGAGFNGQRHPVDPTIDADDPLRPPDRFADNPQVDSDGVRHFSNGKHFDLTAMPLEQAIETTNASTLGNNRRKKGANTAASFNNGAAFNNGGGFNNRVPINTGGNSFRNSPQFNNSTQFNSAAPFRPGGQSNNGSQFNNGGQFGNGGQFSSGGQFSNRAPLYSGNSYNNNAGTYYQPNSMNGNISGQYPYGGPTQQSVNGQRQNFDPSQRKRNRRTYIYPDY